MASIAVKTGAIDARIKKLKYDGKIGWATIFGRIVLGYLDVHRDHAEFDLIVANPTFIGPGSTRTVARTELVMESVAREDLFEEWPIDTSEPRAIVKVGPSLPSAGARYWDKVAAADALLEVLRIPDRSRTSGARILVFDDILTTGHQLDRVARKLIDDGGARHVEASS